MVLLDPSKLRMADISSLWNHWVRRQKANKQGLIFIKAHNGDTRKPSILAASAVQVSAQPHSGNPDEEDFFTTVEREQHENEDPHPQSPAAHVSSKEAKMKFLRGLSAEQVYNAFVDQLELRDAVWVYSNPL